MLPFHWKLGPLAVTPNELFTILGAAFFVSIIGFALLYILIGREPSVPSNATLVLREPPMAEHFERVTGSKL